MKDIPERVWTWLCKLYGHIKGFIAEFADNDGFILAGSISFSTIMSIFPLLLILLSLAGRFLGNRPDLVDTIMELSNVEALLPSAETEIRSILITLSETQGVFSIIGTVLLIWFGLALFYTIETTINMIFDARGNRNFWKKTAYSFTIMVSVFVLFFLSISLTLLAAIISDLNIRILGINPFDMPIFYRFLFSFGPPILIGLFLFINYYFLPARKVRPKAAFYGALFSMVFWETARQLFGWYISNFQTYNKLYGTLGAIVALFIWMYYSAVIFLLGAQLADYIHDVLKGKIKYNCQQSHN